MIIYRWQKILLQLKMQILTLDRLVVQYSALAGISISNFDRALSPVTEISLYLTKRSENFG
jgi:hypothetical protein